MIKLCGFALSNYYNKVKLVLLEKEIPFTEELVWADRSPGLLEKSPLGKVRVAGQYRFSGSGISGKAADAG
jgi:glutathione S-transferase